MSTTEKRLETLEQLVKELTAKVEELSTPRNVPVREMTKDDARRILTGDLKDLKHKDAAAKLGLSYGQIYSCRGKFTFKEVHAEIAKGETAKA